MSILDNLQKNKYLREFEAMGLDESQMGVVKMGFDKGLTIDKIRIYAKPEFNGEQMCQILFSIEANLGLEQISFIANPKLKWYEMQIARTCYENKIPQNEMYELLRFASINGKSNQRVENYEKFLNNNGYFWADRSYENLASNICNALDLKMNTNDILKYINQNYHTSVSEVQIAIEHGLQPEQISYISDCPLHANTAIIARICFENDVPKEDVDFLLDLDNDELNTVRDLLIYGDISFNKYTNQKITLSKETTDNLSPKLTNLLNEILFTPNPDLDRIEDIIKKYEETISEEQIYQIDNNIEENMSLDDLIEKISTDNSNKGDKKIGNKEINADYYSL